MNDKYFVSDLCVGCGGCRSVCPEHCINGVRPPMRIDAEKCVGCGRCALTCPMKAIKIRGEEITV
jgi:NAD-dependent dihydropyrimidine dehydrogenase PreA subunit